MSVPMQYMYFFTILLLLTMLVSCVLA